jgi:hypothetical protein
MDEKKLAEFEILENARTENTRIDIHILYPITRPDLSCGFVNCVLKNFFYWTM